MDYKNLILGLFLANFNILILSGFLHNLVAANEDDEQSISTLSDLTHIRQKRQASCLAKVQFSYFAANESVIIHKHRLNDDKDIDNYQVTFTSLRKDQCSGEDKKMVLKEKRETFVVPDEITMLTRMCVIAQRPDSIQSPRCRGTCATLHVGHDDLPLEVKHLAAHPQENQIEVTWKAQRQWSTECDLDYYFLRLEDLTNRSADIRVMKVPDNCVNNCSCVFQDLGADHKYHLTITPYFKDDIEGYHDYIEVSTPLECTKKLQKLDAKREGNIVTGTWEKEDDVGIDSYRVIIKQLGHETCGAEPEVSNHHSDKERFQFKYESMYGLEFCVESLEKNGKPSCSTNYRVCQRIEPDNKFPQSVESLSIKRGDTWLDVIWHIPEMWKEGCNLDYFTLQQKESSTPLWPRQSTRVLPHENCGFGRCSFMYSLLKEGTAYNVKVIPHFEGGTVGVASSGKGKTFSKLPVAPNLIGREIRNKNVLVQFESIQDRFYSCEIYIEYIGTSDVQLYSCKNTNYTLKYDDLPPGKQYKIWAEVCHSDGGCGSSEKVTVRTPSNKIQLKTDESGIKLINASLNGARIQLPSIGGIVKNKQGVMYVVVSSDPTIANASDKQAIIDITKSRDKFSGRSLFHKTQKDTKVMLTLPLDSEEAVIPNFLLEEIKGRGGVKGGVKGKPPKVSASQRENNEFWVSVVYKVEAGPYPEYEATKFYGPYKFEESKPLINYIALAWAIGALLSLILVVILLCILKSRRKASDSLLPLRGRSSKNEKGKDNPVRLTDVKH